MTGLSPWFLTQELLRPLEFPERKSVFSYVNEVTGNWKPLESFRIGGWLPGEPAL